MAEYFGAPEHLRTSVGFAAREQQRCDAIQADFRANGERRSIRREPPLLVAALTPTNDELNLRLAEELEYARRLLDIMGDALSNDPSILMRHAVPLQSVDIVGQMLGYIARVIRSSDPAGAVNGFGMCELKARLQRTNVP
ncbi:MAG: hypothetical protein ABIO29_07670 [Sphingomicrobium sp.]